MYARRCRVLLPRGNVHVCVCAFVSARAVLTDLRDGARL